MKKGGDPRTVLANERTFLAWLRTGVALMAFGFVVSKFNLFLRLHIVHVNAFSRIHEQVLGLVWVGAGIVVIAMASVHFYQVERHIERQEPLGRSPVPYVLAALLAGLGVLVLVYLTAIG